MLLGLNYQTRSTGYDVETVMQPTIHRGAGAMGRAHRLGPKDVAMTTVYTHVLNRDPAGVPSQAYRLLDEQT